MDATCYSMIAKVIRLTVRYSSFNSATRQAQREAMRIVLTTVPKLRMRSSAKFSTPKDEGIV